MRAVARHHLNIAFLALTGAYGCGVSGSGVSLNKTVEQLNADEKLALCEFGINAFGTEVGQECSPQLRLRA